MKKFGFTLAEVLITLMIIGVVATLTTPALVKNVGSSKIGPQLSKFVNTWETAAESMMMEENRSLLTDYSFGPREMEKMAKYIIMTDLQKSTNHSTITIKSPSGSDLFSQNCKSGHVWQLKDGTIVIVEPSEFPYSWDYISPQGAYKQAVSVILVDIGGIKGSHRVSKEVFGFIIDQSGILVPYGSNTHKSNSEDFEITCSNNSDNYSQALACTGAVADNGYKAPW